MIKMRFEKINVFSPIIIAISIIPFLRCNAIQNMSYGANMYKVLTFIDILLIIYSAIKYKYKPTVSAVCGMILYISLLLTTVLNSKDYNSLLYPYANCVAFIFVSDFYLQKEPRRFVKVNLILASIIMMINVGMQLWEEKNVQILSYKNRVNFFQSDNFGAYYFVVFLCLIFCYNELYSKKQRYKILFVLIIFSTIISWSGTGVAGIIIFIALSLLIYVEKTKFFTLIYNEKTIIMLCLFFFVGIIVLRLQEYFAFFIEGILNKTIDFTYRTYLWDFAFEIIKANKWIGIGANAQGRTVVGMIGNTAYSAHNLLLEMFLQGGIIAGTIFCLWFFFSLKKLKRFVNSKTALYIATAILAQFVMYMFEGVIVQCYPFLVLIMAGNVEKMISDSK